MSASLFSQTAATGGLTGTVKDSSGAVVPNATVTATNIGTSQSRTTVTTAEGSYKFGFLAPGSYKVRFEAAGFSAAEVPSVTVNVTETPVLDQTLSVGGQTQQVEVVGQAEAVQTATSTVGTVVNSKVMTEMPLTSRNYTNLLGLSAGAQTGVFNAANLGRGSQDISVNGSTSVQNNYSMDGASIVNATTNGKTADAGANAGIGIVNPDAIQEFKIQTSLYDAGYGRNPGANVNVVTKSGTNQFHGTAFEFFRNTSLNANEYFRKQSLAPNNTKQRLDQHQFGGTIGGPVKKDKLFFFTSFQETRQKNGIAPAGYSNPTLPGIPNIDRSNTAAFRTALGAAFCPTGTANAGTTGRTQQGGTQVACNGSNINPIAMNLLQLKNPDGSYYIPGSTTGSNQNATFSIPAIYAEHQAIGNFDYLLNNSNTLSGRWSYSGNRTDASMGCAATGTAISQCLPGNPGQVWFQTQYSVLKLTSILTNNVVNEGRFSVQRVVSELSNGVPFTNSQVGISSIVPSIDTLDTFTITGLVAFGGRANLSTVQKVTSWQAADQISWSHGKHTTRAGFEYGRDRQNWPNPGVAIGTLTFSTFQDFLIGLPGCATVNAACATSAAAGQTNGSAFSNIANTGNTTSIIPPEGLIHHYRISSSNAFLQDDYKVFSNLTLNLGIRWEYNGLARDNAGALTTIWPSLINTVPVPGTSAATGTLAGYVVPSNFNFAAYPAPPVGGLYQNNKDIATQNSPSIKNFAPRAGFAWKPLSSDRFVIRGGGGYFYDRIGSTVYNKGTQQNTPYAVPIARSGAANFASSLAQPYDPTARLGWTPRWANLTTGASSNLSVTLTNPIILPPTTYEWNLNMQYEFLPKWVLEVGYVGTRGIHQAPDSTIINILEHQLNSARLASPTNPINGITTNTNANAALRVPYLGFGPGGLGSALNIGDSKYNSLQATVRKQFSHGLQMQAAYTYGR
ncbi:MAG TPA: carboxypeptidase-like regulatory domain-containing protein, partial [Terriglobales bacterium]|nr:carboxypeptidase-like regulatory domain-containing protein [Terriglobales bacterium]